MTFEKPMSDEELAMLAGMQRSSWESDSDDYSNGDPDSRRLPKVARLLPQAARRPSTLTTPREGGQLSRRSGKLPTSTARTAVYTTNSRRSRTSRERAELRSRTTRATRPVGRATG